MALAWLLLHGTPLTPAVWDGVAERLEPSGLVLRPDLASDRRPGDVAAGDRRAHARADRRPARRAARRRALLRRSDRARHGALRVARPRCASLTIICSRGTPFAPFAEAAGAVRRGDPVDVDRAVGRWFRPRELDSEEPLVEYARRCLIEADRSRLGRRARGDRRLRPLRRGGCAPAPGHAHRRRVRSGRDAGGDERPARAHHRQPPARARRGVAHDAARRPRAPRRPDPRHLEVTSAREGARGADRRIVRRRLAVLRVQQHRQPHGGNRERADRDRRRAAAELVQLLLEQQRSEQQARDRIEASAVVATEISRSLCSAICVSQNAAPPTAPRRTRASR